MYERVLVTLISGFKTHTYTEANTHIDQKLLVNIDLLKWFSSYSATEKNVDKKNSQNAIKLVNKLFRGFFPLILFLTLEKVFSKKKKIH